LEGGPRLGPIERTVHKIGSYLWPRPTKPDADRHNFVVHRSTRHIYGGCAGACVFQQIAFSANLATEKFCLILTRVSRSDYGAAGAFVGHDDVPSVRRCFLKKEAFAGVNSPGNRDELQSC
jgi:hypothetical protein